MDTERHPKIIRKPVPTTSSYLLTNYAHLQQVDRTPALGEPSKRNLFSYTHLLAVGVSLGCLLLGILTILPTLSLAWRLGFSGQIVVIGFLLGIMNICMRTVLPFAFLLMEARFGRSRLQNYEAILTGKFVASHISHFWQLALLVLIVLPLGLSVAYKRFLGGTASAALTLGHQGRYGIDFPRIGSWSPANDALYLLISSFAAFQTASGLGNAAYPRPNEFPLAYGYNTLLLSNDSAAILDIPTGSYISMLQSRMLAGETVDITASVDAYVATYNTSTTALRTDDALWVNAIKSSTGNGLGGLSTIYLFKGMGARLGMMPFGNNDQVLFGLYYDSTDWGGMFFHSDPGDSEFVPFRQRAQMYSIKRAQCHGHWSLNTTSILLLDGNCDNKTPVDSSVLQQPNMAPYPYDILPPLGHTFEYFANNETDSVWLRATCAVSVVTMYWARGFFMLYRQGPGMSYAPIDENIRSVRHTLHAGGLLYLVLAVQPALTAVGFMLTVWLYKVPIGEGFGIVSILSGLEPASLGLIQGAGLSGKLRAPVRLDVTSQRMYPGGTGQCRAGSDDFGSRIRYYLGSKAEAREKTSLRRGWMYW
jgi:hypothetical protein